MSYNYSFSMWVPRARLFEVFSTLARYDGTDELAPLIWPDGRRLPICGERRENDKRDLIPFDGSLMEDFPLSFNIEEDEALLDFNESQMSKFRHYKGKVWNYKGVGGRYKIGLETRVHLNTLFLQWLEGEAELVLLCFTAPTSSMSDLFAESLSVQKWFVDLARELGAFSCELNYELFSRFLFLNGEQITLDDLPENFNPDEDNSVSLWETYLYRHPESEAARRALVCERFNKEPTAHERAEAILCLQDSNSGLRALALKVIAYSDDSPTHEILETASKDSDWRVRTVVAHLSDNSKVRGNSPRLKRFLHDAHPEVRIAAASARTGMRGNIEILSNILLQTTPTTENLGLLKVALETITHRIWEERYKKKYGSLLNDTLETILARSDFPFKQTVQEKLNMLRR